LLTGLALLSTSNQMMVIKMNSKEKIDLLMPETSAADLLCMHSSPTSVSAQRILGSSYRTTLMLAILFSHLVLHGYFTTLFTCFFKMSQRLIDEEKKHKAFVLFQNR